MAISKKIRFEVFKRDEFTCLCCGRRPPAVVLEVDHVIPKSKKGSDEIANLVTSCFDCNRGKGKNMLDQIPEKTVKALEVLREQEEQIRALNRLCNEKKKRLQKAIDAISCTFTTFFPGREMADIFKRVSLKKFLSELPLDDVEDAMVKACGRIKTPHEALKYFCGICWKKIKGGSDGHRH